MASGCSAPGDLAPLAIDFYERDVLVVAPELLNKLLVSADGRTGRVVEVEAYGGTDDPASHAFRGRRPRNATMWGAAGRLYVYFTYGMHWCANAVTGPAGTAQAVLLRAVDPCAGLDAMRAARVGVRRDRDLCRGPARLCQAFGITGPDDGLDLTAATRLWLADDGTPPPAHPGQGPRVGISRGREYPWRYWLPGHPGVSRPRLAPPT
jgi:DNA-3-methyladenine glycosylase